jgi:hypothetical protein
MVPVPPLALKWTVTLTGAVVVGVGGGTSTLPGAVVEVVLDVVVVLEVGDVVVEVGDVVVEVVVEAGDATARSTTVTGNPLVLPPGPPAET